jgi:hypothetical protein
MGPKRPASTSLTFAEEALIVDFRKHTRLMLDQSLICLKQVIPTLSRSALQRCLVRYRINRLRGNVIPWWRYPSSIWRRQQVFKIQVHLLAKDYLYTAINEEGLVYAQSYKGLGAHTAADFLFNARHFKLVLCGRTTTGPSLISRTSGIRKGPIWSTRSANTAEGNQSRITWTKLEKMNRWRSKKGGDVSKEVS